VLTIDGNLAQKGAALKIMPTATDAALASRVVRSDSSRRLQIFAGLWAGWALELFRR
jgi:hypothetical protein